MTGALGWTVNQDDGLAVVAVSGNLDLGNTHLLRTALLKCLAEQPDALLVDLAAMRVGDDTALALFTAVSRQAGRWPGTPMLLCAPTPPVTAMLEGGRHGRFRICAGVDAGRRAVADGHVAVPAMSDALLPIAGAARHARNLITEACVAWGLPDLVGPASLVVSELVSNAVEHAGTMLTVHVSRRGRYLHLAVRDGSPQEPVAASPDGLTAAPGGLTAAPGDLTAAPGDLTAAPGGLTVRGRGLPLVAAIAVHWGSVPSRDGKVVWATLAAA